MLSEIYKKNWPPTIAQKQYSGVGGKDSFARKFSSKNSFSKSDLERCADVGGSTRMIY